MSYFMMGGDQREYGPVDADVIRQWVSEGRANGETLLRAEGETIWKPLRSFADFENEFTAAPGMPPPLPGAAAPSAAPGFAGTAPADAPVRIGSAFSRACGLLGAKFGPIATATLIAWMALSVLMIIPVCGPMLLWFFEGPIYAGLFLFMLAMVRGVETSPGDVLTLGRESFKTLGLASLTINMLTTIGFMCCVFPYVYLFIAWLLVFPLIADKKVDMWTGMEWSRQVVTRRWFQFLGLFLVAFLPVLVFHFIMKGMMTAEHTKLLMDIIATQGEPKTLEQFLALVQALDGRLREVLGGFVWMVYARQFILLLTLPLGFATFAYVYEDIFGRPAQK